MTRKPVVQKKIDVGHKLFLELEKISKARGETLELFVSKCLWNEVQK